jgi:hypothetical protein
MDGASDDTPGRRDKAEQRSAQGTFTAPRLADEPDDLALTQLETHAIDDAKRNRFPPVVDA